jgi:hypothetical protein
MDEDEEQCADCGEDEDECLCNFCADCGEEVPDCICEEEGLMA